MGLNFLNVEYARTNNVQLIVQSFLQVRRLSKSEDGDHPFKPISDGRAIGGDIISSFVVDCEFHFQGVLLVAGESFYGGVEMWLGAVVGNCFGSVVGHLEVAVRSNKGEGNGSWLGTLLDEEDFFWKGVEGGGEGVHCPGVSKLPLLCRHLNIDLQVVVISIIVWAVSFHVVQFHEIVLSSFHK